MSEEELIQHCEKQIMLCEALGDYKHCLEHQLTLNIIKQRDLYKEVIEEVRGYIENYDVFKEFSFPIMKRHEENQVKSSIKYEFDTSIKKELLQILDKVKEND